MSSEETTKSAHPQPIGQVTITIMDDGGINVNGFPPSLDVARDWISAADRIVVRHFVKLALNGELDENGIVIEKLIISPDEKKIVIPQGALAH